MIREVYELYVYDEEFCSCSYSQVSSLLCFAPRVVFGLSNPKSLYTPDLMPIRIANSGPHGGYSILNSAKNMFCCRFALIDPPSAKDEKGKKKSKLTLLLFLFFKKKGGNYFQSAQIWPEYYLLITDEQ